MFCWPRGRAPRVGAWVTGAGGGRLALSPHLAEWKSLDTEALDPANDALAQGQQRNATTRLHAGDGGVEASLSLVEALQVAHELVVAHRDPARRHREADAEVLERDDQTGIWLGGFDARGRRRRVGGGGEGCLRALRRNDDDWRGAGGCFAGRRRREEEEGARYQRR